MRCLAIYDIMGIQDFIFSSNKLKENIGASAIVTKIFREDYIESAKTTFNSDASIDMNSGFKMKTNKDLKMEILYVGGGNALAVFNSSDNMIKFNKMFSRRVLENTGGGINLAFAYIETEFEDYEKDYKELRKRLSKNKQEHISTAFMKGISITREGVTDGEPAYTSDSGDVISLQAFLKRKATEKLEAGKSYSKEFDDYAGEKGEQFIAIIHIDGNNMGKIIESKLKGITTYEEAIKVLRSFSFNISDHFNTALEQAGSDLGTKNIPPFRVIVNEGDDITLVCNAKKAFKITEEILRNIDKDEFSACAGIAIIKPHFPFYKAYMLSEELCKSAKKKAKALDAQNPGSWMDVHIQQAGTQGALEQQRKNIYNIPGADPPSSNGYNEYNLLWRPFAINEENNDFNWNAFKEMAIKFEKEFPKSKLKELRKSLSQSIENAEISIKENEGRGRKLPTFNGSKDLYRKDSNSKKTITPYFDAIELIDFIKEK